MSLKTVHAGGTDLSSVLSTAAAELLDLDRVDVEVRLPRDIVLRDIKVQLAAIVEIDGPDGKDPADGDEPTTSSLAETVRGARPLPAGDDDGDDSDVGQVLGAEDLDDEADAACDFVEGILNAMDLAGELKIHLDDAEHRAEIEVVNMDSGALIGRRGATLEAVQELMRCSLQSQFARRVRVSVDIEGYRSRRLEKFLDKADEVIDMVLDSGEAQRLEPMDVFERKAVHELVGSVEGVNSRSQGREPSRRVVIEAE